MVGIITAYILGDDNEDKKTLRDVLRTMSEHPELMQEAVDRWNAYAADRKPDLHEFRFNEDESKTLEIRSLSFKDANLRGAIINNVEMRYIDLENADLRGVVINDSKITDSRLTKASFRDGTIQDLDLSGTTNAAGASFSDAVITGKFTLDGADMNSAKMNGAKLHDVSFEKAKLRGVILGENAVTSGFAPAAFADEVNRQNPDGVEKGTNNPFEFSLKTGGYVGTSYSSFSGVIDKSKAYGSDPFQLPGQGTDHYLYLGTRQEGEGSGLATGNKVEASASLPIIDNKLSIKSTFEYSNFKSALMDESIFSNANPSFSTSNLSASLAPSINLSNSLSVYAGASYHHSNYNLSYLTTDGFAATNFDALHRSVESSSVGSLEGIVKSFNADGGVQFKTGDLKLTADASIPVSVSTDKNYSPVGNFTTLKAGAELLVAGKFDIGLEVMQKLGTKLGTTAEDVIQADFDANSTMVGLTLGVTLGGDKGKGGR